MTYEQPTDEQVQLINLVRESVGRHEAAHGQRPRVCEVSPGWWESMTRATPMGCTCLVQGVVCRLNGRLDGIAVVTRRGY